MAKLIFRCLSVNLGRISVQCSISDSCSKRFERLFWRLPSLLTGLDMSHVYYMWIFFGQMFGPEKIGSLEFIPGPCGRRCGRVTMKTKWCLVPERGRNH